MRALVAEGKSLLPIGVVAVEGAFERGEVVGCYGPDGREIARGLVNYGAQDAARIMRRPSSEIESILGYVDEAELIHRDNLVQAGVGTSAKGVRGMSVDDVKPASRLLRPALQLRSRRPP